MRTRHYARSMQYRDFSQLNEEGREEPVAYQRNRNITFNVSNVDAKSSWWLASGSQVSIVWKNAGSAFLRDAEVTPQYFDNLTATLSTAPSNSVSVKMFYYLDYLTVKRRPPTAE